MSNNEMVSVSRERIEDIAYVLRMAGEDSSADELERSLTQPPAQPVPPAGGEPKVLGYSVKGNRYAIRLTKGELLGLCESYTGDALIELVDRAHVTRLQAALRTEVEAGDSWKREAQDLRAELDALKAQPQGDPVAKCSGCNGKGSVCIDWDCGEWMDCPDCKAPADAEGYPDDPPGTIYGDEQPVPVAVVLPERPRADEDEYERMTDYEKGLLHGGIELWDKISEAIRLNSL
ncbi:hypothetical protein [Pseudomonas chlororaphis]